MRMTNALQVFSYKDRQVRTVERDGEVWFVAKDVCDILELSNPTEALRALDEDEKNTLRISEGIPERGNPNMNLINEPGLYKLAFKSRKPEAKSFSRWVRHEVLPMLSEAKKRKEKKEQMTSEVQVFSYETQPVRTVEIEGDVWFVGKDVAEILGYSNPQEAVRTHVEEEDKGVSEILTPGGMQKLIIINESGLYSLILSSKLPTAKKFKHWVTSEVLPQIRKTGSYNAPDLEPLNVRVRVAEVLQRLALQVSCKAEREAINREAYRYATGQEFPKPEPTPKKPRTPRYWTAQQVGAVLKWPADAVTHRAEKLGLTKKGVNGCWDGETWSFSKEGRRKFLELVRDGVVKIEDGHAYYEGGYRRIYWSYDA